MVDDFVCKVNAVVRHQEEVEKIKSVLHRLVNTSVAHDLPSGWEKVISKQFFQVLHFIVNTVPPALCSTRLASTNGWNKCKTFEDPSNGGSFTI